MTRSTDTSRFYSAELEQQMVAMVRAGRTPEDLAQDFEPAAQTIRNWVLQADRDERARDDAAASEEREARV